ncbi:cysteate synthase [Kitasatospora sp. NPDC085464]|uniref:cysteate synthase n=1 Tax=Kitasatospora sp. NPDC085464 TaxID=3364063 RepID=UPI0037CC2B68
MSGTHYELVCTLCGARHPDDGLRLDCSEPHAPALLRTDYTAKTMTVQPDDGIYRYRQWLPVARSVPGAGRPAVYRSTGLGRALGLEDLWVAFSGYWPERGADLPTGTFKDLEAFTLLGRLPEQAPTLVLASAGNTAAAVARACSRYRRPCLIVVPQAALPSLRFAGELDLCVRVVVLDDPADYADAIALADRISRLPGFVAEGGTRNVARRDGLATAMLLAADTIGALPDCYVQAIGSGAGVLAAHEGAARIAAATGERLPRMLACQNLPFAPVHEAWQARSAVVRERDPLDAMRAVRATAAGELTNRRPAYSIRGGLHDVLTATGGDVLVADNEEAREACELFRSVEGIDVELPAGVALAALRRAVAEGLVPSDAVTLLHVSGGGRAALGRACASVVVEPHLRVAHGDLESPHVTDQVLELCADLAPSVNVPALRAER